MSAIAGRVLLIPKGAFDLLTTYNPLDFVTYGANSYVCKATTVGNLPTDTDYWQLMAQGATDADDVNYDNTVSGLTADDVQEAVDELASEKQDKNLSSPITVDGTSKSTVETALSGINTYADKIDGNVDAVVNVCTAKNFILYPYYETTKTENGLTFTDNGNGTVTVSGTASADTYFMWRESYENLRLPQNGLTYRLTGCPSGGSASTYSLFVNYKADDNTWSGAVYDYGDGVNMPYSYTGSTSGGIYYGGIQIKSGTNLTTPIIFKPMLRDARITDDTYVPYAMTNRELTEKVTWGNDVDITINSTNTNSAVLRRYGDMVYGNIITKAASGAGDIELLSITNTADRPLAVNPNMTFGLVAYGVTAATGNDWAKSRGVFYQNGKLIFSANGASDYGFYVTVFWFAKQ